MAAGRVVGDRFELGPVVGAGGMGQVFRALDRHQGTQVAVKLLHAGIDSDRFVREGALLAQLHNEHVVGYVAHGQEPDGTRYLAMEWIDGETVHQRLSTTGFDVQESLWLALSIARGLAATHAIGVVHRDIKPSNVLLPDGDPRRARIVDFGLGRVTGELSSLTRTGMILGTPGYLAPEQALGQRTIDERADLFALGVILYEALAGRPAFIGSNSLAVVCKVITFEPPPLAERCPEAPAALIRLCEQLLDKDPARRPASAAEVARALEAIAIADPGRRRARRISKVPATEIATEAQAPWTRFVALATPPLDDEGVPIPPAPSALDQLAARAGEQGVALSTFQDGALLAVVAEADESEGARRAGDLALLIAEVIPGAVVVVSGARGGDARTAIDSALDVGTASIELAVREAMFSVITGPTRERAVRVDELTASLLRPPFRVERVRGVSWLIAEAR